MHYLSHRPTGRIICLAPPYRPSSTHRPTNGLKNALAALHQKLANERGIIVHSSCYGPDNQTMMDTIGVNPRAYRGVYIAKYIFRMKVLQI